MGLDWNRALLCPEASHLLFFVLKFAELMKLAEICLRRIRSDTTPCSDMSAAGARLFLVLPAVLLLMLAWLSGMHQDRMQLAWLLGDYVVLNVAAADAAVYG
jgi:hypothetical protein